jgi:aryl-alcohol dehydrogenase-like predicted oxidoreductase
MTRERIKSLPDDDWRKDDARFREPLLSENLATADMVGALANRLGVSPGAVAIAWTLRNPAVDGAIVGIRRPDQVDELLSAATLRLPDEDAAELDGSQR